MFRIGAKVKKYTKRTTGIKAAVSLQKRANVNVIHTNKRYLSDLFWVNSLKKMNDKRENRVNNKSPRAGIQATDETNRGWTQKMRVPMKATLGDTLHVRSKKNNKQPIVPNKKRLVK